MKTTSVFVLWIWMQRSYSFYFIRMSLIYNQNWISIDVKYCFGEMTAFCFIYQVHVYLQARVSQDYHLEPEQWRIGISSILASALLLAPSKDTFWTTVRQTGNPLYPGISTFFFHHTESVIFYCIGKVFIWMIKKKRQDILIVK